MCRSCSNEVLVHCQALSAPEMREELASLSSLPLLDESSLPTAVDKCKDVLVVSALDFSADSRRVFTVSDPAGTENREGIFIIDQVAQTFRLSAAAYVMILGAMVRKGK